MSFSRFDLDPRLGPGLAALGFDVPTPIQAAILPRALAGQDVIGSAETGTGKTAAYLLPILHRLLQSPAARREPRALVLVPTRELALQVAEHAEKLSGGGPVRTGAIFGGVSLTIQERLLKQGLDFVIATPGRLLDHLARRNVSLSGLQVLVLDEADRMLDVGFYPDIMRVVREVPRQRQTMLFSATLPEEVLTLARLVTREAVRVQAESDAVPPAITQTLFPMPEHLKPRALQQLIRDEQMDSVLVFARTKHRADRVARQLQRANIPAGVIHGDRSQSQRNAALDAFRRGRSRVLVATDVAARGIDVPGISHVVNYDVPVEAEGYVHRIGRTGRAEAAGKAYTLVTPPEESMVRRIEALLQRKLERRRLEGIDYATPAFVQPDAEAIRRYVAQHKSARG